MGLRLPFAAALGLAAALGCSTETVVFEPPPQPSPSTTPAFQGAANMAPNAPLPVSGGTLLTMVRPDGAAIAVASDPDEDAVHFVSLANPPKMIGTVWLQPGDEPGRLVADAAGRVHVALRRGGAVATLQPTDTGASLVMRRDVCSAPRGLDYDAKDDSVWVACATGELTELPAAGGAAANAFQLDRDLRDVVVDGDTLYVTRFRSAQILTLTRDGTIQRRDSPNLPSTTAAALPDVAWRAVHAPGPGEGLLMVFQVASTNPIDVAVPPGVSSYGGQTSNFQDPNAGAGGVVSVAIAAFSGGTTNASMALTSNPVVDLAVAPSGAFETLSVDGRIDTQSGVFDLATFVQSDPRSPNAYVAIADARAAANPVVVVQMHGPTTGLVLLSPASGNLAFGASVEGIVAFPQKASHLDTGFDVFSQPTAAGVACMNCHPEGGDDSHTWRFHTASGTRERRTQALRGGGITDSAPYHWDGDMVDLQALCDEVFTHRMGGDSLSTKQTPVLARFLGAMPRVPVSKSLDPLRVAKGQAIFVGSGGCATCHAGGAGTLPTNVSVGKTDSLGSTASLQVPMLLGVADRAPYMHDGCAQTLMDRLDDAKCAGAAHGNTAQLGDEDKQNLVQYLESL